MSSSCKKIRITVVGDGGVGKTSMLVAYKDKVFYDQYTPTVFDVYSMTVPINGEDYTIILSDTAGQEEFDKLRKLSYTNIDVFIICYAIDQRDSFENIKSLWYPEIKASCPKAQIVLVGTKLDTENPIVTYSEGGKMARKIGASDFLQNSAKTRINIDETFNIAINVALLNSTSKKSGRCCVLL